MNSFLRPAILALTLSLGTVAGLRAADPGYVDFGSFKPSASGDFVQVDIKEGLLKFASKISGKEEPAAAEILRGLKRVQVNVISFDDSNRADTLRKVEALRADLSSRGWEQVVTVRGKDEEDVAIYVKSATEELIEGVVVTVIKEDREAVLVNVVGTLRAEDLAKVGERFDIDPLKRTRLADRR